MHHAAGISPLMAIVASALAPSLADFPPPAPSPVVLASFRAERDDSLDAKERAVLTRLRSAWVAARPELTEIEAKKEELAEENFAKNPCTLVGVECAEGHVISLSFRKRSLAGSFPADVRRLQLLT